MYVIGHRGAAGLAPENTISGFRKALETGVDAVEFDVQSTPDGAIVLSHDKPESPNGLVTLEEALDCINGKVDIVIDVKPGCDPIILISHLDTTTYKGHITIASKSPKILALLKAKQPDYEYALQERYSGVRASYRARKLGITRLHFQARVLWSGFIKAMNKQGYEVYAYTVNDPRKAAKWERSGLKGVFTDRPDLY